MNFTNLVYNAAAHFAAQERYPEGLSEALSAPGGKGFEALCWAVGELSTQGELIRRDMGHDKKEPLTAEYVRLHLKPSELLAAKSAVIEAMIRGLNSGDEDEEVDEVLAELQKKTEV